jgi:predicted dehydrogenase
MEATTRPLNNFDTTKFEELNFQSHPMGMGQQCIVQFSNGYGASIVQSPYTYGGPDGLYELAVFGKDGSISYDTPVTSDVEGYLTEEMVTGLLEQIQKL